jgi:hypothetical protein
MLVTGWLVQAYRPRGPYPVLCLHGEQGSAKSTAAKVLRALLDPASAPLRSEPREPRDLMIAASNSWVIAYDNLSRLPEWLSDCICRLATGGGFSTRELYSDADEVIFDSTRPVCLSSIEELAIKGDLLDRCLIVTLPAIDEKRRCTEKAFWQEFEQEHPKLLGAFLSAVSAALANVERVRLDELPRMADFAQWVTAAEPALGWEAGAFMSVYASNRESANELVLEGSSLVPPLKELLGSSGNFEGTARALLEELTALVSEGLRKSRAWPKTPRGLSGHLRRIAPNLRNVGIYVHFGERDNHDHKRSRLLRIENREPSDK